MRSCYLEGCPQGISSHELSARIILVHDSSLAPIPLFGSCALTRSIPGAEDSVGALTSKNKPTIVNSIELRMRSYPRRSHAKRKNASHSLYAFCSRGGHFS